LSYRQAKLDEYVKEKCRVCGRIFTSRRALNIHLSRKHGVELMVHPGEGVELRSRGRYGELRVRLKKTLIEDLLRLSREENLSLEELVIAGLVELATQGRPKQPSYLH